MIKTEDGGRQTALEDGDRVRVFRARTSARVSAPVVIWIMNFGISSFASTLKPPTSGSLSPFRLQHLNQYLDIGGRVI